MGRLGRHIIRGERSFMVDTISNKEKNIYLGFYAILWILITGAVYELGASQTIYLFIVAAVWAIVTLIYQKRIGIEFSNKTNAYLESIDKKYKLFYFLTIPFMAFAMIFSISINLNFIILLIIIACYQVFMTYKMIHYAY